MKKQNDKLLSSSDTSLRLRDEDEIERERSTNLPEVEGRALYLELEVRKAELDAQNEELRRVQAELAASEVKYRDLYELASIGYLTLEGSGRVLDANLASGALLGTDRVHLVNDRFQAYLDQRCIQEFNAFCGRVMESDEKQTAEFQLKSNGLNREPPGWVQVEARAIREGINKGFRMAVIDITDRKQAEEALRVSERWYHLLFENMLDGFAYCRMLYDDQGRPKDFIYLDTNSAFEKLTGLKGVIGKSATEAIPGIKESHPELFDIYGRVALTGKPERFEIEFKPLEIWLSISVYSTERYHFAAVFENITERKLADEALRRSEEHLRLAAEGGELGTYTYDFISGKGDWSPELKAFYGLRAYEPLVLDEDGVAIAIHPEDRSAFLSAMIAANDPYGNVDGILELEYRIIRTDGSIRWLRVHGRTEFMDESDDLRPWRAAGVVTD